MSLDVGNKQSKWSAVTHSYFHAVLHKNRLNDSQQGKQGVFEHCMLAGTI